MPTMDEWTWYAGNKGSATLVRAPIEVALRLQEHRSTWPLGFLSSLEIYPEFRRQGWATSLMKTVCKYCDKNSIDLWLYASPYDPVTDDLFAEKLKGPKAKTLDLKAFYSTMGFVAVPSGEYRHEMVRRWVCSK